MRIARGLHPAKITVLGMSDDRLAELRRQRALAAEKQAELEREIAAAEAAARAAADANARGAFPSPARPIQPQDDAASSGFPVATPGRASGPAAGPDRLSVEAKSEIDAAAQQILESHRLSPKAVKSDVFRGCLLYLVLAFALTGVGAVALYFVFKLF